MRSRQTPVVRCKLSLLLLLLPVVFFRRRTAEGAVVPRHGAVAVKSPTGLTSQAASPKILSDVLRKFLANRIVRPLGRLSLRHSRPRSSAPRTAPTSTRITRCRQVRVAGVRARPSPCQGHSIVLGHTRTRTVPHRRRPPGQIRSPSYVSSLG